MGLKKEIRLRPICCLWNDQKSVNGSVCSLMSIGDKWAVPMKPRSTSLSLSLCFPLSFSLFLNSAISVCLSVCLALLSVCLSLFLCLSLSSNLRLDLLNPHTVRLTYTIIRIKTRWWDWRHLIIWANSLVNCYFSLKVTKLDDLQFRFTILYNISILLSLRSLRMNCFIRAKIPSSLEWKLNVVCLI